jgi:hypothetical protein
MARAAFPIADRVSLADVGEHMKQKSDGHEGLALSEVQAALVDGCGVELIWIKEGQEACREYPNPDFFRRQILSWHGVLPRRLHIQLPPEEQKGDTLLTFLCLTDAVRRGLRPASDLPQSRKECETVAKLSGKRWVSNAYGRRPDELLAMGITGASEALAEESKTAPDCAKPLIARYIEKLLRERGTFPKAHRGSPKQRPK